MKNLTKHFTFIVLSRTVVSLIVFAVLVGIHLTVIVAQQRAQEPTNRLGGGTECRSRCSSDICVICSDGRFLCSTFNTSRCTAPPAPTPTPAEGNPFALITIQSNTGFAVDVSAASTFGGNPPYTFSWAYGDGFGDTGIDPAAHTYTKAGTKTITLTVTDSAAGFNVSSITVTVAGAGTAPISAPTAQLPTPTPIPTPRLTWKQIASCPAPTRIPTPTPTQIAIVPTSSPTPTSAPASTACSSATTCATCILGPTQSTCGWDGSTCQTGTKACPSGKMTWNWNDCSKNECSLPTPTSAPTPTPIPFPTQRPIQCDIDTEEGQFRCRTNCILNEIEVGGSTTCNRNPGTICCFDRSKRSPTPTPIPTSQCGVNDCGGPGACGSNSACIQNPNNARKDCTCQSIITPAPTSAPAPSPVCPLKPKGDADCNGQINIVDFNVWRDEFTGKFKTTTADFNGDGNVDIKDFSAWRDGFIAANIKK